MSLNHNLASTSLIVYKSPFCGVSGQMNPGQYRASLVKASDRSVAWARFLQDIQKEHGQGNGLFCIFGF